VGFLGFCPSLPPTSLSLKTNKYGIVSEIKTTKGASIMSKAKVIVGRVMRKTLAILVVPVLLVLSFTLSSCKDCGKKKPVPADRGGSNSDKDSSDSDAKDSSGDSSSTTDSGGGSSSGGDALPLLTPAQLLSEKATKDCIDKVLVGYKRGSEHITKKDMDVKCIMNDIEPDTKNAFTRAFLESYNAWQTASKKEPLSEYLNKVNDIYYRRICWAIALRNEYNKYAASDDMDKSMAMRAHKALARCKDVPEVLRIIADIKGKHPESRLIKAWNAFEAVSAEADKQWEELYRLVDADRKSKSK
jgi:hypothetical protein